MSNRGMKNTTDLRSQFQPFDKLKIMFGRVAFKYASMSRAQRCAHLRQPNCNDDSTAQTWFVQHHPSKLVVVLWKLEVQDVLSSHKGDVVDIFYLSSKCAHKRPWTAKTTHMSSLSIYFALVTDTTKQVHIQHQCLWTWDSSKTAKPVAWFAGGLRGSLSAKLATSIDIPQKRASKRQSSKKTNKNWPSTPLEKKKKKTWYDTETSTQPWLTAKQRNNME